MRYRLLGKMVSFSEAFSGKGFICCKLTALYSIYSTVGRSISSISDLSGIFTLALRTSVNMSPPIWYIGYRPPYCTSYMNYELYTLCYKQIIVSPNSPIQLAINHALSTNYTMTCCTLCAIWWRPSLYTGIQCSASTQAFLWTVSTTVWLR